METLQIIPRIDYITGLSLISIIDNWWKNTYNPLASMNLLIDSKSFRLPT